MRRRNDQKTIHVKEHYWVTGDIKPWWDKLANNEKKMLDI
jgi:hypothetical protein